MPPALVPVRCPGCRGILQVPAAPPGTQLRCSICQTAFLAPPAAPMAMPLPPHLLPPPVPIPPSVPLPRSSAMPWDGAILRPPPSTGPGLVPSAPPSPAEKPDSEAAQAALQKQRRSAWFILAAISGLVLITVVAGTLLSYVAFRRAGEKAAENEAGDIDENSDGGAAKETGDTPSVNTKWASGEKGAILGRVEVKVLRAEFGPIRARRVSPDSPPPAPGEFLKVYVQIENTGKTSILYTSWLGNRFAEGRGQTAALLFDQTGRQYVQHPLKGVQGIEGHTLQETLKIGESTKDVIIFAAPADRVHDQETVFRLQLPAKAVQRGGYFRLEIPRDMIADF